MNAPCNCFVARHPKAAEIDAALLRGDDPRDVAARYDLGKSRVYDHRKHLRDAGITGPAPEVVPSPAPSPPPAPPAAALDGAKDAPSSSPAPSAPSPPAEPVKRPPAPPVERSMESVEPRMESRGMDVEVPAGPSLISARALPQEASSGPVPSVVMSPYTTAVKAAVALITDGKWRAGHVDALVEKYGIARNTARSAHAEAVRHLQMNMGDYGARQAVSAAYVVSQRDAAKAQSTNALRHADRWRAEENRAQEAAAKMSGEERQEKLKEAAHYGLLATKYDLSAEKWSAQALAHQRHLDDVLCLRSPKNNFGAGASDGGAMVARLAAALARRFRDRPDVLADLEAAAAELERASDEPLLVESEAA